MFPQILDANINRVSEGLRVIEDYVRFVRNNKVLTDRLVTLRHQINRSESKPAANLAIRDTDLDVRAKEVPAKRQEIVSLLKANFKRVQEGLRVLEEYTGNSLYNGIRYDAYALEKDVLLPLLKPQVLKGVYFISDSVAHISQAIDWGVSMVQLRDKYGKKSDILEKAKRLSDKAKEASIPFIINDFLDIALLVDADGLHTGQDDLCIAEQRKLLGEHKLIGRTTHSLEQGLAAQIAGADYVSVGPIWETPSKPGRAGIGFDYLALASESLSVPFVAIGGVNADNIREVLACNPTMIGLIRDFPRIREIMGMMR